tara:strand:+ start:1674 stop:2114 length:441 start_codon:yes stop_codon:yes gene_type:complete
MHRPSFNLSLRYEGKRDRIQKGGIPSKPMQNAIEGAKSNTISLLTGLLGVYFTASMWVELQDSLGLLIGAPLAVVITTTMLIIFQSKRQQKEIQLNGNYDLHESFLNENTDPLGAQKGRNPVMFIVLLYLFVVVINEAAGTGLIFN